MIIAKDVDTTKARRSQSGCCINDETVTVMFIRARQVKGQIYYQLVRGYRDGAGKVRQETMGITGETVGEALEIEKARRRRLRQEQKLLAGFRNSDFIVRRRELERVDKRLEDCEARIEKLKMAQQAGLD